MLTALSIRDVVLIERGPSVGRGIAYAASEYPYLLNVPAARLSADSSDPLQFLRFAQRRMPYAGDEDFLPRALYGDYLEDMLLQAERAAERIRLKRVFAEARGVQRVEGEKHLAVQFADRTSILADSVVLALGSPAARMPPWAADLKGHSAFRQDPRDLPLDLAAEHSVLIIGNGLTMADAATALSRDANSLRIQKPHPSYRTKAIEQQFQIGIMAGFSTCLGTGNHGWSETCFPLLQGRWQDSKGIALSY